jgi:hypothetical protein
MTKILYCQKCGKPLKERPIRELMFLYYVIVIKRRSCYECGKPDHVDGAR